MKNSIILIAAILVASLSNLTAQTEKGKTLLTGNTNLSFASLKTSVKFDGQSNGESSKSTNFEFSPGIGYLVADNLAVLFSAHIESANFDDKKTSTVLIGPGLRYFFGQSNIKPYLETDIMFGSQTTNEDDFKVFGYDFGAGISIFFNKYVALDLGLSYADLFYTLTDDENWEINVNGIAGQIGIIVSF